jgi:chromate reductase, NAD(P)H dehydrogenase (quinone)
MLNNKIGIVIGTNRQNSFSNTIANYYANLLKEKNTESIIIDLAALPKDFGFTALYENTGKNEGFNDFQKIIDESTKLIFVVPEYNGSYPGILKTFIDGLRHPNSLAGKKICMVGLSSGVLGNAVGLGHLNDVLSYLNANVLGQRIKLGGVSSHFANNEFTNDTYKTFVNKQIEAFLAF